MSAVSRWNFHAYKNGDPDGAHDETREITEWQIDHCVSWARHRGYDMILLSRETQETGVEYWQPQASGVDHSARPAGRAT